MTLRCTAGLVVGWILVALGTVITPLPIPVGLILVGLGVSILMPCSALVRRVVKRLKRRYRTLFSRL